MFLVSSCSCLCPVYWSHVSSWEWRCSWSSADRQCSNYIWVINNLIGHKGVTYIRDLMVGYFPGWVLLWLPLQNPTKIHFPDSNMRNWGQILRYCSNICWAVCINCFNRFKIKSECLHFKYLKAILQPSQATLHRGPFYLHGCNQMHIYVWDKIIHTFPNFNSTAA